MDTYIAINTLNGKFYIGSTIDFEKRKLQHLRSQGKGPFHEDLQRNPEVFEWTVFSDKTNDSILERALLEMWHGKGQCYNISSAAKERGIPFRLIDPNGKTSYYSSIREAIKCTGIKRQRLKRWLDGFPPKGKWKGWSVKALT